MDTNKVSHKMNGTVAEALQYAKSKVGALENYHDFYAYSAPIYQDNKFIGHTRAELSKTTHTYKDAQTSRNKALLEAAIWFSRSELDDDEFNDYMVGVIDKLDSFTIKDVAKAIKEY